MKFSELQLNANVLEALDAMRFDECTPIQEQAIPIILEGKDLIAVAQTGTGKTAAFLLPVLNKLSEGKHPEDAINCVIMSPTRELAQQIDQQMEGFSYFMPVSSVAVYGGNDGILFEQQKKGLTLGADVVIATPGRLIAHLSLGYVDLSKVSYFILDEADRMLDMGFYEDIMQIAKYLPKERQTIMFSATMPAKIQQLANTILNDPSEIKLAVSKPAEKIIQAAYVCYENQKLGIIRSLFMDEVPERVIVFASSKIKVKEVAKALKSMKLNVGEMHSDLEQAQRETVMHEFKAGRINRTSLHVVSTSMISAWLSTSTCLTTARTTCTASAVQHVPTMTGWHLRLLTKRNRVTSKALRIFWRKRFIRFLSLKDWERLRNTNRVRSTKTGTGISLKEKISGEKETTEGRKATTLRPDRNKICISLFG